MREHSDKVVDYVVKAAARHPAIRRIYLFGSRAKNTGTDRSDYDFAVEWDTGKAGSWGEFTGAVREGIPTLHQLDLVRLDLCDDDLKEKILKEGVVIHERQD